MLDLEPRAWFKALYQLSNILESKVPVHSLLHAHRVLLDTYACQASPYNWAKDYGLLFISRIGNGSQEWHFRIPYLLLAAFTEASG